MGFPMFPKWVLPNRVSSHFTLAPWAKHSKMFPRFFPKMLTKLVQIYIDVSHLPNVNKCAM